MSKGVLLFRLQPIPQAILYVKHFLLIISILVLSGCAVNSVKTLPTINAETPEDPSKGRVVARVINASSWQMPFNYLYITPKNVNESDKVKHKKLVRLDNLPGQGTVFAANVEPGTYIVLSIASQYKESVYGGTLYYHQSAAGGAELGTFNVVAGKTTDLGNLIYSMQSDGDKYRNMLIRSPTMNNGVVLKKHFPYVNVDSDSILSWTNDDMDGERNAQYVSLVQNPISYNDTYLASDGTLYFPGKIGTIMLRTPDGDWDMLAIDTDLDLHSLVKSPAGDLLVGADEGHLFLKRAGQEWEDIGFGPGYHVEDIQMIDDHRVEAAVTKLKSLKIVRMSLRDPESGWENIIQYDSVAGWYRDKEEQLAALKKGGYKQPIRRISGASFEEVGGVPTIFFNEQYIDADPVVTFRRNQAFTYDHESWSTEKARSLGGIDGIIDVGANTLGLNRMGFWSMPPAYFRYNLSSDKWEKINTSIDLCPEKSSHTKGCTVDNEFETRKQTIRFYSAPVFSSEMEGTAIAYLYYPSFSKQEIAPFVFETKDAGKTWKRTEYNLPSDYCTTLVPQYSEGLMLSCKGLSSSFYISSDGGKTWEIDREHESY